MGTRFVIACAAVAALAPTACTAAYAEPVTATATVLRVVDGDTIDVRDDVRGRLRIRILGIDTPETKKPGFSVGCWGPQATQFAKDTLQGQRVAFLPDPTQDRVDRYGRTLAYLVKGDGRDYSVEAARAGTAHSYIYDNPVRKYAEIYAAEQEARAAGRGLWGPPCFGNTESERR
jgi:micrococcal nuclease